MLAAANALLLRGSLELPAHCIRNSVASLEDISNLLANRAMQHSAESLYVQDLLHHIPRFQHGMDVNPNFTDGPCGYEYTSELTAFDMLQVKLVHGWLVDPEQDETCVALGTKTYNEVVEWIIKGNEAAGDIDKLSKEITELESMDVPDLDKLGKKKEKLAELEKMSLHASLMNNFLQFSGHQLTQYGLNILHETLNEDELCVFFRNNHFGTLTKHEGLLYLLITDLGYANAPAIIWEKLDVIDGDTELFNSRFERPKPAEAAVKTGPTLSPEQLMAQSGQNDADFHLAMHLSMQESSPGTNQQSLDEQEGDLVKAATEASLREYNGIDVKQPSPAQPTLVTLPEAAPASLTVAAAAAKEPPLSQEETDRQLAMQLHSAGSPNEEADRRLAMELQNAGEDQSMHLARQLQEEENQRAAMRQQQLRQQQATAANRTKAKSESNCVIS